MLSVTDVFRLLLTPGTAGSTKSIHLTGVFFACEAPSRVTLVDGVGGSEHVDAVRVQQLCTSPTSSLLPPFVKPQEILVVCERTIFRDLTQNICETDEIGRQFLEQGGVTAPVAGPCEAAPPRRT